MERVFLPQTDDYTRVKINGFKAIEEENIAGLSSLTFCSRWLSHPFGWCSELSMLESCII